MSFIYFLGAREQRGERQTRWTPLWIPRGTTSDTQTLGMHTGKPPCTSLERVHLGSRKNEQYDESDTTDLQRDACAR